MSLLKTKLEVAKAQCLKDKSTITKDEFLNLFEMLRPYYDLEEEAISQVFDMTDQNKQGVINVVDLERIFDTILSIEEPDVVNQEGLHCSDRVSLCLKQFGRSSVSGNRVSLQTYFAQNEAIMSDLLVKFDPSKISEIKYIFGICDSNKGYASLQQIKDFAKSINGLSCTQEEILGTFSLMKDEKQDIVTKETFLKRMSEFERIILSSNLEIKQKQQSPVIQDGRQIVLPSMTEVESNSSETSEKCLEFSPDFCYQKESYEPFNEGLEQEVNLILNKVELSMDQIKKKAKDQDVIVGLGEIPLILSILEKKIKHNENIFNDYKEKLTEHIKIEDLLRGIIVELEMNSNSQKDFFDDLQRQNDELYERNQELEIKTKLYDHLKQDLEGKSDDIARLERRLRQTEHQNKELENQITKFADEKKIMLENFNQLQMLVDQWENEGETGAASDIIAKSSWSKYTMEIEALKSELLNTNKGFDKEKENFQRKIADLEMQLQHVKSFSDGVLLEKMKLEKELKALQDRSIRDSVISQRKGLQEKSLRGSVLPHLKGRDTINILSKHFGEGVSSQNSSVIEDNTDQFICKKCQTKSEFSNLMEEKFVYQAPDHDEMFPIYEHEEEQNSEILNNSKTAPDFSLDSYGDSYIDMNFSQSKPRLNHDLRNLSKDYLSIRNHPRLQRLLRRNNEQPVGAMCFSDYIYRINSKEHRQHRIIFITCDALYCLHPRKNYQVQKRIPLHEITEVTIITSSAGLCIIHSKNSPDYFIESYKRLNLILFLQGMSKMNDLIPFVISSQEKLLEKNDKPVNAQLIEQYKTFMNPELQPAYKKAVKCGELYMKSGGLFSTTKKYFFLLTDVGLLCFKKSGDSKPIDFIPVIDHMLIELENVGDRKNMFELKFPYSEFEVQLAADSELGKREWVQAIKRVQKDPLIL